MRKGVTVTIKILMIQIFHIQRTVWHTLVVPDMKTKIVDNLLWFTASENGGNYKRVIAIWISIINGRLCYDKEFNFLQSECTENDVLETLTWPYGPVNSCCEFDILIWHSSSKIKLSQSSAIMRFNKMIFRFSLSMKKTEYNWDNLGECGCR